MLSRPITTTGRAILVLRDPCHHAPYPGQFLKRRKFYSKPKRSDSAKLPHDLSHMADPATVLRESRAGSKANKKSSIGHSDFTGVQTRQGSIVVEFPSTTTQKQILKAIETRFRPTTRYRKALMQDPEQAVVILATPKFASWLEDDTFIAGLLGSLTQSNSDCETMRNASESQFEEEVVRPLSQIDVLCACIDGLSPDADELPYVSRNHPTEGFSILQGPTLQILPNLWNSQIPVSTQSPPRTATLSFGRITPSQDQIPVILPLANTLFSNGKHSTLLASKWTAKPNGFVKVRIMEKSNQVIGVFDKGMLGPPSIHIPATALTPVRRIVSGLGNIVKQIDFGEQGPGPASRELETNIERYSSLQLNQKSAMAVWALIVPNVSLSDPKSTSAYELVHDREQVEILWQSKVRNPYHIGFWLLHGAKFHRVLSGGGGWGAKQGLLSLDPQSAVNDISEARFDYSTGSLEDQQKAAWGKIAEVDASIQFFIAENPVPVQTPPKDFVRVFEDMWRRTTVIGTVPSSIDSQKTEETGPSVGTEVGNVIIKTGHFGAVSESGIFLSTFPAVGTGSACVPVRTKIDLPYSYVYRDMRDAPKPVV